MLSTDSLGAVSIADISLVAGEINEISISENIETVVDAWNSLRIPSGQLTLVTLSETVDIVRDAWTSVRIEPPTVRTASWSDNISITESWNSNQLIITGKVAHIQMLLTKLDIDFTLEKLQ